VHFILETYYLTGASVLIRALVKLFAIDVSIVNIELNVLFIGMRSVQLHNRINRFLNVESLKAFPKLVLLDETVV
jgi:hypothetical protein